MATTTPVRINEIEVEISGATVSQLETLLNAMRNALGVPADTQFATAPGPNADAEELPSEEEVASLLESLDAANESARRILDSMDRTHEEMQAFIQDVRETRRLLAEANAR
jgi:hypothetical protein